MSRPLALLLVALAAGMSPVAAQTFSGKGVPPNPCDINGAGGVDAVDVQLVINGALAIDIAPLDGDVNGDDGVNALDVQLVINCALALPVQLVVVKPSAVVILEGDSIDLVAASTDPADIFQWVSDNEDAAVVDDQGRVTGLDVGQALITVTGQNSGAGDVVPVTVGPKLSDQVLDAFAMLAVHLAGLPDEELDPDSRGDLGDQLADAEDDYRVGLPCEAAATLDEYLDAV